MQLALSIKNTLTSSSATLTLPDNMQTAAMKN